MASAASVKLSHHDSAVVQALFDPEASLRNATTIDETLPEAYDRSTMVTIEMQERQALWLLNEDVPATETINSAIEQLSQIIKSYPKYASAWNNRAQATRMLFDMADAPSHSIEARRIYDDLTTAIELCKQSTSLGSVSSSIARVLANACTHRGFLLWRASRPEASIGMLDMIPTLKSVSKEGLEELASRDFAMGGRYGNKLAPQLSIRTNPYAKLCGSIVREAISKEIEDFKRQAVLT